MAKTVEELEEKVDERLDKFEKMLLRVVEKISPAGEAPAPVKTEAEKASEPVGTYQEPVHPEWLADAKEKLGDKLDHCEVDYPKNGNPRYTVVIKKEFSNAPKSILEYYKVDRRTVPVINGLESVKSFNSLVAQNLRLNPKKLD